MSFMPSRTGPLVGTPRVTKKDKGETTRLLQHVSRIPEGSSGQDENVQIEDVGDTDEFDA
jgi:hypothetical protein